MRTELALRVVAVALALAYGCSQDMANQPKYRPQRPSPFFDDGRADRPRVPNTVARGEVTPDDSFHTGKVGNAYLRELPVPITRELLLRGRERFDIYCSVCHGRAGTGDGMIVRRGFRRPSSFHVERLRTESAGYFFDTITNGFGVMPSYAGSVPPADRWAIVAYIRALQLSQNARLEDVPPAERAKLREEKAP